MLRGPPPLLLPLPVDLLRPQPVQALALPLAHPLQLACSAPAELRLRLVWAGQPVPPAPAGWTTLKPRRSAVRQPRAGCRRRLLQCWLPPSRVWQAQYHPLLAHAPQHQLLQSCLAHPPAWVLAQSVHPAAFRRPVPLPLAFRGQVAVAHQLKLSGAVALLRAARPRAAQLQAAAYLAAVQQAPQQLAAALRLRPDPEHLQQAAALPRALHLERLMLARRQPQRSCLSALH